MEFFKRTARRLDALTGRAVFRAEVPATAVPTLAARLERAVRDGYEPEGFDIRVEDGRGNWFLRAHRGAAAGFCVGMLAGPGRRATVSVGVGRSARVDEVAGWAAGGLAVVAAAVSVPLIGAAAGPLPGPVVAGIALGVLVVILVAAYQLLLPAVVGAEVLGRGRFTRDQMVAVVTLVRGVIEAGPDAAAPR